ncbi:bromodomain adjacent to zinc finger domain protein 1A-like [Anopheles merus]|uniref:Bromodomain adjacent to zinc finger domain protein 1A n=1 Tax=Anopheles merus TaxID=30066 RepID=A0A182UYR4_ANOME|nr:bromodomain adjacent to zinc finger domain protein 1A-like [Anopheles merus]XP_041767069.1 bromodomain adjacent to zinc finger domain protein 1A-like [Anopheles merus]
MPLLKRKPLQKVPDQERLKDGDEVFVCETTGELFSDYDDFFNRTMLLSSTVWSCAMTGRSNLTYADALESEKAAKRTLKSFPTALKGPILLIASRTKRTAIHELASDVHGYAKDVFFKGETVYTKAADSETVRKGKIVRVVLGELPSDHQNPSRLLYQIVGSDDETPASYTVRGDAVTRERNCLSREKCKLFLKQHVELGPDQVLCVKKASLEQFVTSKGCTDDKVFYGQTPDFGVSKKLLTKETTTSGKGESKKKALAAKAAKAAAAGEKKVKTKEGKPKGPKGKKEAGLKDAASKKQQSMAKYMQQATPQELEALNKKKLDEKNARAEERDRRNALAKERKMTERKLLLSYVAMALKQYDSIHEDQELTDQRVLPPARPVQTQLGAEHFPSFMFILEFLHQFGDILSIEEKFPGGVTMELLERALLGRAVNGPLSDIFQVLLCTLFAALKESHSSEESNLPPETLRVVNWCQKHFAAKLTELPMDSTTVTELLRLHLVAYGQPNHFGDACFTLIRDHPQLMRTLTTHTVFQLPTAMVLQVLCALVHQLLQLDEVLERVEKVGEARAKFNNNRTAQRRLAKRTASLKQAAQDSMMREMASLMMVGDQPADSAEVEKGRARLKQKLQEELAQIEANASKQLAELKDHYEGLKLSYGLYEVYLGSDRAFRNYWKFESLPGLFVEHDGTFAGCCSERVTPHLPCLVACDPKLRKKYITDAILKCAGNSNGLLDGVLAGRQEQKDSDICAQLLLRGIALQEKDEARKKNPFSLAKAGENASVAEDTADNKMEIDEPDSSVPPPAAPPTNRELLMCTGNPEDCTVHIASRQTAPGTTWSYYATADEVDALIASLNERGLREKSLRKTLEQYRDGIVERLKKCPVKSLSHRQPSEAASARAQHRRQCSTLPVPPEAVTNETLEMMFRDQLLDMEGRIHAGCLGELKVNSIEKWRTAILNRSYDAQITGQLQWGVRRRKRLEEMYSYEKLDQDSSSEDSGVEETEVADEIDLAKLRARDPGYGDLDSAERSENGTDGMALAETSDEIQRTVHSLACALLQVAQSIEPKFLRHPFGPKGRCKDRNTIATMQFHGQKRLLQWEGSLMRATSYSQLFLHYHILYDALCWSRSIERAVCMVCRRKGDANLTLLCDECNRACHMYCLKPKLKKVPEGDWFCTLCRPSDDTGIVTRKRTQIIEDLDLDSDNDSTAEATNESEDDEEEDEEEEEEENEDEAVMESEDSTTSESENRASDEATDTEEAFEEQPKIVLKKTPAKTIKKQEATAAAVTVAADKQASRGVRAAARKQEQESATRKSSRNSIAAKRARLSDGRESSEKKTPAVVERSSRSSTGRRSTRLSGRGGGET